MGFGEDAILSSSVSFSSSLELSFHSLGILGVHIIFYIGQIHDQRYEHKYSGLLKGTISSRGMRSKQIVIKNLHEGEWYKSLGLGILGGDVGHKVANSSRVCFQAKRISAKGFVESKRQK